MLSCLLIRNGRLFPIPWGGALTHIFSKSTSEKAKYLSFCETGPEVPDKKRMEQKQKVPRMNRGGGAYTFDLRNSALSLFLHNWAALPLIILFMVLSSLKCSTVCPYKGTEAFTWGPPPQILANKSWLWSEMQENYCVRNAPLSANVLTSQVAWYQC